MHGGPLGAGPEARPRPTSHRHMTVVLRRAESDGRDRVMPCYRDDRFGLVTRPMAVTRTPGRHPSDESRPGASDDS